MNCNIIESPRSCKNIKKIDCYELYLIAMSTSLADQDLNCGLLQMFHETVEEERWANSDSGKW